MIEIGKDVVVHHDGVALSPELWGVNRFPDGQIQFWADNSVKYGWDLDIAIKSSEHLDLFLQMIYTFIWKTVRITYLYGSRCDKATAGNRQVTDTAWMMDWLIESLFDGGRLEVVAPHHDTALLSILPIPEQLSAENYDLILFPDESAAKRFENEFQSITKRICTKRRNQVTGEIISHELPEDIAGFQRILVVDDLCDGGRTFLSIADMLQDHADIDYYKLDLFVVHGVFSNGAIPKLKKVYDTIYTTNSYQDFPGQGLVVKNVWRSRL